MNNHALEQQTARPGYVIIAVLLVIVVLSLVAYRFADAMSAEFAVAYRTTEAAQVKAFAVSGVHYAAGMLADPTTLTTTLGGNPYDNADYFSNIAIGDTAVRGGGRFALMNLSDDAGGTGEARYSLKYGATDEAGKINLNAMMRIDTSGESLKAMLILLPNMTEDIADAIVDWLDTDDDVRANGAESSSYDAYKAKNGPLSTLDELLLVRGVTPQLLYGNDRNRNGKADPGENDGNTFNRGWSDYLTIYGHELNIDSTGQPRIFVNGTDLHADNLAIAPLLGQEMADYISAYRMYSQASSITPVPKGYTTGSGPNLRYAVGSEPNSTTAKRTVKNSVLSLMNTRVTLPKLPNAKPDDPRVVVNCPLNDRATFTKLLPMILDLTTAKSGYELNPRINISTAPQDLLATLPGLTPDDVTSAISARANITPGTPEYATGAWLVTQAGMRPEIFQQLERYITGQTMTYRVQSIGYFTRGGPVARVEAVIDTNGGRPRIVYFRDLTDLGGGFTPPR